MGGSGATQARRDRSLPPSVETTLPPACFSATSISFSVTQVKSSSVSWIWPSGSSRWASKPDGDQQHVRREIVERWQDAAKERLAEAALPSSGLSGALKMLPSPVSLKAPVPGKSGI